MNFPCGYDPAKDPHRPAGRGEYEAHAVYYLRGMVPGAAEDLKTNTVRFKVEK